MAVGAAVSSSNIDPARAALYQGKATVYVILTCVIAASGGLMFGYDIGVSGGVTSMDDFLAKFFPEVLKNKEEEEAMNNNNNSTSSSSSRNVASAAYCQYNDQILQLFTSSLYLAALAASFLASWVTRKFGRKRSLLVAGLLFDAGVLLNAAAHDLPMLILGRIALGCGVGFANQAVPLFLSEIAPTHWRGALNILFQLNITIGILFANLVNYGTLRIRPWGWRLSLGIASIPAIILTLGSLWLVETPNSLVERGLLDKAKATLKKIRGTEDIDVEFHDLVEASKIAQEVKKPFKSLFQASSRPQLVITFAMQLFQQFTGINAIMFYAPILFQTLGFQSDASLYSSVITGTVNVLSTIVSICMVDRLGRKILLLEACAQMFFSQVIIAILLGVGLHDGRSLSHGESVAVVLLVCVFVSAFAWSWGPLGWLIPSEIFPLETRSSGQSVTVCINMLFTFIIGQAFLSMLCTFKYAIFLFFASWIVVMGLFTIFFIPETKNIPIEEMAIVWKTHWLWKRVVPITTEDDDHELEEQELGKVDVPREDEQEQESESQKVDLAS